MGQREGAARHGGIGAFLFVLTISGSRTRAAPLGPVAIGSVLAAIACMGWHVSRAGRSPAVTLARPPAGAGAVQLFLVEFLFALVPCLVVVSVALSRRTEGNGAATGLPPSGARGVAAGVFGMREEE